MLENANKNYSVYRNSGAIEEMIKRHKGDKPSGSILQKDIFNQINDNKNIICKIIEEEKWIKEIAAPVDILITTGAGKKIIIQVDGPSHFLSDSYEYNGSTKFNTNILEKLGYMVIRIAYFEIDKGDFSSLGQLEHLDQLGDNEKMSEPNNFEHKEGLEMYLSGEDSDCEGYVASAK